MYRRAFLRCLEPHRLFLTVSEEQGTLRQGPERTHGVHSSKWVTVRDTITLPRPNGNTSGSHVSNVGHDAARCFHARKILIKVGKQHACDGATRDDGARPWL